MKNPKISIIVPIYNVENFLDRCMKSLVNQTLTDIEIIMVDDGSPDKCPQMCDEYAEQDSRIKIIHKQNAGLGLARNSGLDIATGEYVAFVDSDDYVDNFMYEKLYNEASIKNYDAVYCGFAVEKKSGGFYSENQKNRVLTQKSEIIEFCRNMIACDVQIKNERTESMAVWHAIYRKSLIDCNNIRFKSEREILSEDIVFDLSLLPLCNKIRTLDDVLYIHCYNTTSLSKTFKEEKIDRNLSLYHCLSDISQKYGLHDFKLNIMRFFLGYNRSFLKHIFMSDLSVSHKKRLCKKIYGMKTLSEILRQYPIKQSKYPSKLIFLFIKNNMFWTPFFLYKLLASLRIIR